MCDDIGIFPRNNDDKELLIKCMSDVDYCALVCSLNEKQREFFYHVLHSIKTKDEPRRLFLSGGAGIGKSTFTNALYEASIRYLNTVTGENPDDHRKKFLKHMHGYLAFYILKIGRASCRERV